MSKGQNTIDEMRALLDQLRDTSESGEILRLSRQIEKLSRELAALGYSLRPPVSEPRSSDDANEHQSPS